jgi:aminoglycoside 6'-N-acetyltransferase I
MNVVEAKPADLDRIDSLRRALWPDSPIAELKARIPDMTAPQPRYLVLIALSDGGAPIGFAEVALRGDYVNGCDTSPVAFLEGIYVDPEHRQQGVARALVAAARDWARARGLAEFASDALIDNHASHAFHKAVGFAEAERVVYFHMSLEGTPA